MKTKLRCLWLTEASQEVPLVLASHSHSGHPMQLWVIVAICTRVTGYSEIIGWDGAHLTAREFRSELARAGFPG